MRSGLPIDEALGPLSVALRAGGNAVVVAPPGAGKSTVVPLALLEEPWARAKRIVMLEPRRLATRAVAERMAATLGERAGETVGYRMRLETRVGKHTRVEVVTEGVFTRLLQSDPALEGVAAVLFDEYHERSLHADVGLAFVLDAQRHLAPDLRVLAMSATIDGARVATLLGGAPVIESLGRMFPVEVRYVGKGLPALPGGPELVDAIVARAVHRALAESSAICSCSCPAPARSAAWSGGCAKNSRSAPTSTCCRSTASLRPASRTQRSRRRVRGAARSCSQPTSRRRA